MACYCGYRKRIRNARTAFDSKTTVYMDYNATTPVDPAVLGEFDRVCRKLWANPSSLHSGGIGISDAVTEYTDNILQYLRPGPGNLYYCSSGSEAVHAGIMGTADIFSSHSSSNHSRKIITTSIEHAAVKHPLRLVRASPDLRKLRGRDRIIVLPVNADGQLCIEELVSVLNADGPSLLVYSPVNHETGSMQQMQKIYHAARKFDCLVFLDAVQACARLAPEKWAPFCDLFAFSGHKIYAPKGIAGLFVREGLKLKPFRFGGFQQDGIFPGTENTPGIAALSRAVDLLRDNFAAEQIHLTTLCGEGISILQNAGIDFFVESPKTAVPGTLCVSFPRIKDMENLMFEIDRNRICVSRFSACTSSVTGPSSVLKAMGRPVRTCKTSMRLSLGRWSTRDDFFKLARVLRDLRT